MALNDALAVFIDAENLNKETDEAGLPLRVEIILRRLAEEGTVCFTKAYGDWRAPQLNRLVRNLLDNTVEMAMLATDQRGKNTADVQLAVDALEMALLRDSAPTTIAIVSGDRDFVPLAQKIRRYGIKVIGIGLQGSTSRALARQCNQYFYYDDLVKVLEPAEPATPSPADAIPPVAASLAVETPEQAPLGVPEPLEEVLDPASSDAGRLEALRLEAYRLVWRASNVLERNGHGGSLSDIGQLVRQLDSTFSLQRFGFESLKQLVLSAQDHGWVSVSGLGDDMTVEPSRAKADEFEPDASFYYEDLFANPAERLDDYKQVLADKRVPLLPYDKRLQLIEALWAGFDAHGQRKLLQRDAVRILQAQDRAGESTPLTALRKLVITLSIAGCFEGLSAADFVDEYTLLRPCATSDEAMGRVDRTYIRGILIDYPSAPLEPEPVAMLLYGRSDEESIAKATAVIRDVRSGR